VAGATQFARRLEREAVVGETTCFDQLQHADDAAADGVLEPCRTRSFASVRARAAPAVVLAADPTILGDEGRVEERLRLNIDGPCELAQRRTSWPGAHVDKSTRCRRASVHRVC